MEKGIAGVRKLGKGRKLPGDSLHSTAWREGYSRGLGFKLYPVGRGDPLRVQGCLW